MISKNTLMNRLPSPKSGGILIEENQDVDDIINLISYGHKRERDNYDAIADEFWMGNVYDTCEYLWDWCKTNLGYKVQGIDLQSVRTPQRILKEGLGDCKHYALFIAGILDALTRQGMKIDWFYRFASYDPTDKTPGHVFVVVNDKGRSIWIDPVLQSFNYHKWYWSAKDISIKNKPATMGGIGRLTIGDNTGTEIKAVGNTFVAVAPVLAAIPAVGPLVAGAVSVVGKVINIIGGLFPNWQNSTGVRWLIQLYQYYVLGQCNVTSDNHVDEKYMQEAHTWFAIATGIPVFDRYRWDALKGYKYGANQSLNETFAQRIAAYQAFPDSAGVPYDAIAHAVNVVDAISYNDPCGGWADIKPANVQLTADLSNPVTTSSGAVTTPESASSSGGSNTGLIVLAVAAVLALTGKKKRKK